jgi:hypothetical protein
VRAEGVMVAVEVTVTMPDGEQWKFTAPKVHGDLAITATPIHQAGLFLTYLDRIPPPPQEWNLAIAVEGQPLADSGTDHLWRIENPDAFGKAVAP